VTFGPPVPLHECDQFDPDYPAPCGSCDSWDDLVEKHREYLENRRYTADCIFCKRKYDSGIAWIRGRENIEPIGYIRDELDEEVV